MDTKETVSFTTLAFNDDTAKNWLKSRLGDGPVKVTFVKKNGEDRVLNCTLKSDVIPLYEKKTDKEKAKNDEVLSVWDLDINEWRSFRFDSIKRIEFDML